MILEGALAVKTRQTLCKRKCKSVLNSKIYFFSHIFVYILKTLFLIENCFFVCFLSLCSVNLALGLMANDPVSTPLICYTYLPISLLETKISSRIMWEIKADSVKLLNWISNSVTVRYISNHGCIICEISA